MTAWIKVQKQKFYTPMEFSVMDFLFDTAKMCWIVDGPGPLSGILSFYFISLLSQIFFSPLKAVTFLFARYLC